MKLEHEKPRCLVIGYGNIDRADDGVAFCVVNALRRRLGREPLSEGSTGLEELGAGVDSIFLVQLVPEITDMLADYQQIVFVDAHVHKCLNDLHCSPVSASYAPSAFTHHMSPAMVLALIELLHHSGPAGHIVSIRGYDFDFHRGLSAGTRALVVPAVELILRLVTSLP